MLRNQTPKAALFLSLIVTGCGSNKDASSEVKIVNGAPAPGPTDWQPALTAVVKVKTASGGLCTGTFVRPNVLLTAAHCTALKEDGIIGKAVSVNGVTSSETIVAAGITDLHNPSTNVVYDLAVIKFSQNVATTAGVRSFPQIQTNAPAAGSGLMIAGFGRTANAPGSGVFHWGTNTLAKRSLNFLYITAALSGAADGTNAVSEHGDSGGPMFNMQKQLIGTTRAGAWEEDTKNSTYTWLGSESSRALLKRAGLL